MQEDHVLEALGALSQETRLRIIRHLVESGPDGASAGDIGSAVEATSSRLSFHLTNLEHAGLVQSQRVSRNIVYRARFDQIGELLNYLLMDCCANHPDIRACCNLPSDACCE
ncbi:MAG: ArsR family transcriptional regulator [Gammaproteobacteria bacterium]|jgi:ArsR family transcriptional regulator